MRTLFHSRLNVQQVVGFLVMEVRMMERASDNMTNGEGGQHQSSVGVTHIVSRKLWFGLAKERTGLRRSSRGVFVFAHAQELQWFKDWID